MGAQMRLLVVLIALCTHTPVCGDEGCSGFKHLENGRTFFRYGGLLVIFSCRPNFRLHGYRTNSCVSGQWSRDPPVCVGSGCSSPGELTHGTTDVTDDGSWAAFSCNRGFQLHGPSMLYCKGHSWNSTKPVCKESDLMGPLSVLKANTHLSNPAGILLKQQFLDTHTNTASKVGTLSNILSRLSDSKWIKETEVDLQLHQEYPDSRNKDSDQTGNRNIQLPGPAAGSRRHGSEDNALLEETGSDERVTQVIESPPTAVTQVVSQLHLPVLELRSTPQPFSTAGTSATTAVRLTPPTDTEMSMLTLPHQHTKPALHVSSGENVLQFEELWNTVTPSRSAKPAGEDHQAPSGFQLLPLLQSSPVETSLLSLSTSGSSISSTSSPFTSSSARSSSVHLPMFPASSPSSLILSNVEEPLPDIKLSTHSPTEPDWTHHQGVLRNVKTTLVPVSLSRRPVCQYPPVPAHGTFYFRNVENPGPRDYRHYIQYACYPGYTLAHGDVHSYCQQGGTWSGVTPVCLEVTPCSVDNGGCSQLCSHHQLYNQTRSRTWCHCRPGFTLLDDGRTCRDIDECAEGQHRCQQRCINTFGSFKCICDVGYEPAHDQISCTDVDECVRPAVVTGCVFSCVNTPGSFHCQCPAGYSIQTGEDRGNHCKDIDECAVNQGSGPCMEQCHNTPGSYRCSCTYGHILAGDGHSCMDECPPGYRKQSTTPMAEKSVSQTPIEECVDIDECKEEKCDWQCVNLPGSHHCICPRGYTLQRDARRCKDINECSQKNGGCSHLCVNQRGRHKCACPASHRLSPYSWKKCVPRIPTANPAG